MSRSSVALVRETRKPLGEGEARTGSPRVLIVEDERIVAADLQRLLRSLGYDAYGCAATAARAFELAAETPPDVVLADVRIEGPVDGIDAAFQLRKDYGCAVIFLTAHADDPTVERAKYAEPSGYLIKPIGAAAVKAAIEMALDRRLREAATRALEQALSATSADLLSALNHLPLAVQLEDTQGRVMHVNPAFRELFQITEEGAELVGVEGAALMAYVQSLCRDGEQFGVVAERLRSAGHATTGDVIFMRNGRRLGLEFVPLFRGSQWQGRLWTYHNG